MIYASIPGLNETKQFLREAVQHNHLAHAQLFVGAPGALNLPMALACATYLHCENKGEDACGQCSACTKSLKYIHPDTHFVFPVSNVKGDKDEERFKSDILKAWRQFLKEQPFGDLDDWTNAYGGENKVALISREESREIVKALSLKPFESPYKVMIIWQPERMHPAAANGILKILEEPPPQTYFILVTNAADQLLPTIVSRTQIVTVPLLADEDLTDYLISEREIDPKRAAQITQLADGRLAFANQLIENTTDEHAERFVTWMRACFKRQYDTLVDLSDEYHKLDKLSQRNMLAYGMNQLRETLLCLTGADNLHRVGGEELKFTKDFSKVFNFGKLERSYQLLNDASYHLERNGSAKMIFMDLSLNIANTLNPI